MTLAIRSRNCGLRSDIPKNLGIPPYNNHIKYNQNLFDLFHLKSEQTMTDRNLNDIDFGSPDARNIQIY